MNIRIGHGLDVHQFDPSRPLILGGIEIPNAPGLKGHSDADVILHALLDAIFGAAGMPDIGQRYPNTDPSFEGVRSTVLLKEGWEEVRKRGFSLINADMVLLAEKPKISPFIHKMIEAIAREMGEPQDKFGLKATTCEKMGFIGREEGVFASAVVLLNKS